LRRLIRCNFKVIRPYGPNVQIYFVLEIILDKIKQKGFQGMQRSLTTRFGTVFKEEKETNIQATCQIIKREHIPVIISSRKLSIYLTNKYYEQILTSNEIEMFDMLRVNNPRL
jgi:hypothetical protein